LPDANFVWRGRGQSGLAEDVKRDIRKLVHSFNARRRPPCASAF
jgi:hypothetical protein